MALPLKPSTARGPPYQLPRYLQLKLSRHVLCNIARFCFRAHTLSVETGCQQIQIRYCDKCSSIDVQDETVSSFYALAWNCAV